MSICYYCYWGWPKPIADIYDKYAPVAGESAMHYGPAHVVWDDENWDCAQSCLDEFDEHVAKYGKEDDGTPRHTSDELEAVRQSLKALVALPDEIINSIPSDYDDENPAKFPPSWEAVHR